VEVHFYAFLTLALGGGEWSASYCSQFTPREKVLVPIGQEAGWDPEMVRSWWDEKIPCPCQELKPGHPILTELS